MAATHHEPISYLDSILNEEENRCEYSHTWRNFTISRSGRFKSKNKKRDTVDTKLFDAAPTNHITTNNNNNHNNNCGSSNGSNSSNNATNNSSNHKLDCNNGRGVSGAASIYNTLDKYNSYGTGGAYNHATSSLTGVGKGNKSYHPQQMHQQQQQTAYAQRDSYKKYYETNL